MAQYKRIITNTLMGTFLAIKRNDEAFGISGKDSDGKYFWLTLSREKLTEIRDWINQILEG